MNHKGDDPEILMAPKVNGIGKRPKKQFSERKINFTVALPIL